MVKKKAQSLPTIKETLKIAQSNDILEVDEVWSFSGTKKNKLWLWTILCRRTRQIVAYFIGDRTKVACKALWKKLPESYRSCLSFSDFLSSYASVFPKETHTLVGKETGETAHMERWNLTLRQRNGRYVRKTLSFSKKESWHHIAIKCFITEYNLSLM